VVAGDPMRVSELPQVIPVFPLDGVLLLPDGTLPLNVFEPRYLNMIDDAMAGDRMIGVIQSRSGGDRQVPRLMAVGCVGRITSFTETPDGRYLITLTGVSRFSVRGELDLQTPYRQVRADYGDFTQDLLDDDEPDQAARDALFEALKSYLDHRGLAMDWDAVRSAPVNALVSSLCMALPFDSTEKQALLEAPSPADRRAALITLLRFDAAGGQPGEASGLQ
jgi:Lon protease-like protein